MKNSKKFMVTGLVILLLLSSMVALSQAMATLHPINEQSSNEPEQPQTPSDEPVVNGPITVTGTQLDIEVPLYVYSGQSFLVVVTAEGKGIENVLVILKGDTQRQYTSTNGSVWLTAPVTNDTKNVSIIASKEGYLSNTQVITVYAGYLRDSAVKQLTLDAPKSVKEGEKFIVRVTYLDSPIEHAVVTASWGEKSYYTDRDGAAELIAPDTKYSANYTITASKDGYENATVVIMVVDTYVTLTLAGDINQDGRIDITDAVYLLSYIFSDGPAPKDIRSADVNGDLRVDISDVVYLLAYIFGTGPVPVSY